MVLIVRSLMQVYIKCCFYFILSSLLCSVAVAIFMLFFFSVCSNIDLNRESRSPPHFHLLHEEKKIIILIIIFPVYVVVYDDDGVQY